ncbi:carbohydrate ABC transporter permease [Paenibacillus filicis]|uniref:Carbohydrate ABC transporter permease n=1 Tax=Paenibacillus gyeongsangnamensis TaxID=3388067 RepID=A0ABT4Q4A6_9BACL|nr:carbohydrate ABC transporter permease [Paenibacillus filicis]MCZ8511525.1 carbohydrate ABC transporter permease [Paenibacillus filicis]
MFGRVSKYLLNAILLILGGIWLVPFLWMVSAAFRSSSDLLNNPSWIPAHITLKGFQEVWTSAHFPTLYSNTLWIVTVVLIAQYFIAIMAAYVFARRRFPGSHFLFLICMIQLFIPGGILIVPNYETIFHLGLINTKWAIVLPSFASSFAIFYLRQAFKSIPVELEEAAVMDGAVTWHLLRHVFVPLSVPALTALGIVSVSSHWNDFLWPLLVTNSPSNRPVTVGLALFAQASESAAEWPLITAATLIVICPLMIVFIIFQRKIVESFLHTGIK